MSSKHAATETRKNALCLRDLFLDGGGEPDLLPTHQSPKGEGRDPAFRIMEFMELSKRTPRMDIRLLKMDPFRGSPKEISAIVSELKMSISQRGLPFLDHGPEATFLNKATWILYL